MGLRVTNSYVVGHVSADGPLVVDNVDMWEGAIGASRASITNLRLERGSVSTSGPLSLTASRLVGWAEDDFASTLVWIGGGESMVANNVLVGGGGAAADKSVITLDWQAHRSRVTGNTIPAPWGGRWDDPPTVGVRIAYYPWSGGGAMDVVVDNNDMRGTAGVLDERERDVPGTSTAHIYANIVD